MTSPSTNPAVDRWISEVSSWFAHEVVLGAQMYPEMSAANRLCACAVAFAHLLIDAAVRDPEWAKAWSAALGAEAGFGEIPEEAGDFLELFGRPPA